MSAPLSVTPVTSSEMLSGPGNVVEKSMVECWSDTPKGKGRTEEIEECWSDTVGIEMEVEDEEGDKNEEVESKEEGENEEMNCCCCLRLTANMYSALLRTCSWDCSSAESAIS